MQHAAHPQDGRHDHQFHEGNPLAERNTLRAALLTVVMMVVEIAGGWIRLYNRLYCGGYITYRPVQSTLPESICFRPACMIKPAGSK